MLVSLLTIFLAAADNQATWAQTFAPTVVFHHHEDCMAMDPLTVSKQWPPASPLSFESFCSPTLEPNTPLFWSLSQSPFALHLKDRFKLIEYWYFSPFNRAGQLLDVGDHEGDWESIAVLFTPPSTTHAVYMSQHDGGTWYCPKQLRWNKTHPMVFSALGTHASYPLPGLFSRGWVLGNDFTGRGKVWTPMNSLRVLIKQDFYNYSGLWGGDSWLWLNRAPLGPHHQRKYLPPISKPDKIAALKEFLSAECGVSF